MRWPNASLIALDAASTASIASSSSSMRTLISRLRSLARTSAHQLCRPLSLPLKTLPLSSLLMESAPSFSSLESVLSVFWTQPSVTASLPSFLNSRKTSTSLYHSWHSSLQWATWWRLHSWRCMVACHLQSYSASTPTSTSVTNKVDPLSTTVTAPRKWISSSECSQMPSPNPEKSNESTKIDCKRH